MHVAAAQDYNTWRTLYG